MFKKLFSLFSKEEQIEEVEEEKEEEVEEKKPLPDIIEVPWKDAAGAKNFEDSITQMHSDLKDFYYKTKMNEYRAIKAIERLEESTDRKIEEEGPVRRGPRLSAKELCLADRCSVGATPLCPHIFYVIR